MDTDGNQRPKRNTMHLHGVLLWYRLAAYLSGLCAHGRCASDRERRCAPMETQFAIVVYRRRRSGFLILLCSLALLFPPPAIGSGHSRASLCLSSSGSLHLPPAALTVAVSQAKAFHALSEARPGKIHCHQRPKKNTMLCMVSFFGIRRLPIFPGRLQPSIVGV